MEKIDTLRKKAMNLPLLPGVYIMKNQKGEIIYIGKAKLLKNRVSQYFGSSAHHTDKVKQMVSNVNDFEYIICKSEYEALILECSLIKQHTPKYNILLKDDKGFHYIKISKPPYPILKAAMQKQDDGCDYIGPYYSHYSVRLAVDAAQRAFKLPRCSKKGKDMGKKGTKPCLNYHIGLCSAPCCNKISRQDYEQSVKQAVDFITAGANKTISLLTSQMNKASQNLEFEKAARLRDSIKAIKDINKKQQIITQSTDPQDVFAFAFLEDKMAVEVFCFREGKLFDREQFFVDITDKETVRGEFLTQYYSLNRQIPKKIYIDSSFDDIDSISEFLSNKANRNIQIVVPKIGDGKRLVDIVKQNAIEFLSEKTKRKGHNFNNLEQLTNLLGLQKVPTYIESYDISHTAGSQTVGAMVVYKDGAPYKAGYRKFKLDDYKNDDYACTRQIIERRFNEYKKGQDSYFSVLPDLILLDGGIGQYNAVKDVIPENVPFFAMVKNDKHKTKALISESGQIALSQTSGAYLLVYSIQEEVHRFAIGYHKAKRKSKMLGSSLSAIEGLGPVRIKNLLLRFSTIENISKASIEQLQSVNKMTKLAAKKVYEYFNGEKNGKD